MKQIQSGVKARDVVTGFEGIVTGKASYLTGCDQYLLAPPVDESGSSRDGKWFDVNRLEVTDHNAIVLDTEEDKGACESAPVK